MKIALLNLQYDNNYGGNLQRFALMKVLQDLGHDITHINLRFNYNPDPWNHKFLRFIKRLKRKFFYEKNISLFPEYKQQKSYERLCSITDKFYYHYIKHTQVIGDKRKLSKLGPFDVYVVGSDQVWRKTIAKIYGIETFFFDFLPADIKVKRIAYGVSLGTFENELDEEDLKKLTPLYHLFNAVSVREDSALELFSQYGWNSPRAEHVLDPTLLLSKEDYVKLIKDGDTYASKGNMFCYILDPSEEKDALIKQYEQKLGLQSFQTGLNGDEQMSIPQWLRSFYDSDFIVTDSYHGMVFSIIFHKPFKLIYNHFRGNARFESLMRLLEIPEDTEQIDWKVSQIKIKLWRDKSLSFLRKSI